MRTIAAIILLLSTNTNVFSSELLIDGKTFDTDNGTEAVATLCHSSGSKSVTGKDILWLARMINGETWGKPTREDSESMIWSISQRAFIGAHRKKSITLLSQQYSQPISRKWLKGGSRCKKYYRQNWDGSVPSNCRRSVVNRRSKNREATWDDLPFIAKDTVVEFVKGSIPNSVPGAVGWYSPKMWKKRENNGRNRKDNQEFHSEIDGNVYFYRSVRPNTGIWDASEVRVVTGNGFCG